MSLRWILACSVATVLAAPLSASHASAAAGMPAPNPFLAGGEYPIGHTNSGQVDSTVVPGPTAPSHKLAPSEIETALTGPGHLGNFTTGKYPNGHSVIWTNNPTDIVKMDHDTLRVLTTYKLKDEPAFTEADGEKILSGLKSGTMRDRFVFGGGIAAKMFPADLASVYTMVDRDNNYYVGNSRGLTAYGDATENDPDSQIVVKRSWTMPAEIPGVVVGMNMTYDGWIVLATDLGVIVTLSRDFTQYHFVQLPHNDEAPAYNARMAEQHRSGYNWIRNSIATDDVGGIYVAANNWMEKIVWKDGKLSVDMKDGAWSAQYSNSTGTGTGSTPALMGFGKDNRFVVITDGDTLMQVTMFWRDGIPAGWKVPAGALSDRVAGVQPVTMGDPNRKALQSEQAVVVAGYDMAVVNNQPASVPPGLPAAAKTLLISLFGDDPAYTPHGLEKFTWDTKTKALRAAWTNTEVSSPNCVPFISLGSKMVYTVGVAKDGNWMLESMHLDTGTLAAKYEIGDARFNTMFAGIYVDDKGRIIYGGMFGAVRLNPTPRALK